MAKKLGKRSNKGKSCVEQIPYEAEEAIGYVFLAGQKKYGKNNWKNGLPFTQFLGSAKRHIGKFSKGIDFDDELKTHHIANAATNLIMLLWMIKNRPDLDDRWIKNVKQRLPKRLQRSFKKRRKLLKRPYKRY